MSGAEDPVVAAQDDPSSLQIAPMAHQDETHAAQNPTAPPATGVSQPLNASILP